MNLPPLQKTLSDEKQKVLVAYANMHKGMLFGIISNGGKFNVGEYQVEIIAREGQFVRVQLNRYALDASSEKQTWVRTKTKKEVVIKEVPKKQTQITELQLEKEVVEKELF